MTLAEIIKALDLKVLTEQKDFSQTIVSEGYTSDLLSCVMAGAPHHGLWITLQSHNNNIVAVAALLEIAAVVITEDSLPDETTVQKANEEGIILLSTPHKTFHIVGNLWELGIRSN